MAVYAKHRSDRNGKNEEPASDGEEKETPLPLKKGPLKPPPDLAKTTRATNAYNRGGARGGRQGDAERRRS